MDEIKSVLDELLKKQNEMAENINKLVKVTERHSSDILNLQQLTKKVEPSHYTWTGTFNSLNTGFLGMSLVHGEIHVILPANIKNTVDAEARLTYKGFYRHGQTSVFKFSYGNEEGSGNQVGYLGNFKGGNVATNQTIRFNITMMTETGIYGNYESSNPRDQGTFSIQRL